MKYLQKLLAVLLLFSCLILAVSCKKKTEENKQNEDQVIVNEKDGVRINYSEKTILLYEYFTLTLVGTEERAEWKSSDTSVVRVSESGEIYGVSIGNAVITATVSGKDYSCRVSVSDSATIPVIRIDLVLDRIDLDRGASYTLSPVILYNGEIYTDAVFTFTGYDAGMLTVSADGVITAASSGDTVLTVNAQWRSASQIPEVDVPIHIH